MESCSDNSTPTSSDSSSSNSPTTISKNTTTTTAEPDSAGEEGWIPKYLTVDSVIDTPESRQQMAEIKSALMGSLVPSFYKWNREHQVDILALGIGSGPPQPGFDMDKNFEMKPPTSSRSSSGSTLDHQAMNTLKLCMMCSPVGTPLTLTVDASDCIGCNRSRKSLLGAPPPPDMHMYQANNVWGQEPQSGPPPGFAHPYMLSQGMSQVEIVQDIVLKEVLAKMNLASASHQRYVPAQSGPFLPGYNGVLTGLHLDTNSNMMEESADSFRTEILDWARLSPENSAAYGLLMNVDEHEANEQMNIGWAYAAAKGVQGLVEDAEGGSESNDFGGSANRGAQSDIEETREDFSGRQFERQRRDHRGAPWCNFCFKGGVEATDCFHYMNDPITGETKCPKLLSYNCPQCGELGHTKSYCPLVLGSLANKLSHRNDRRHR